MRYSTECSHPLPRQWTAVFFDSLCIECDACLDICPTQCLTITTNGEREDLLQRLKAPVLGAAQPLFVSDALKQAGRVMVKDENFCIHCGLCAERCPTGAWDMQKFLLEMAAAGPGSRAPLKKKAAGAP